MENLWALILGVLLPVVLCIAGCTLLLYPTLSQRANSKKQAQVVHSYVEETGALDDTVISEELERARAYNDRLRGEICPKDPFAEEEQDSKTYEQLLRFGQDGIMGYVEIPKIEVMLPIYHGVGKDVLSKGIGHLPESSLPVGGEGTHCVLAGHSGMSYARLFTDLPDLKIGDQFFIHTYGKTLTYTVDQIKTVLPSDTRDLAIETEKDFVTLVTCTPYGVNSHRLLVRGEST